MTDDHAAGPSEGRDPNAARRVTTPTIAATATSGAALGRALQASGDINTSLAAEAAAGKADRFATLENAVATVMATSAAGSPPLTLGRGGDIELATKVPAKARSLLAHHFDLPGQQGKGAWWLPENVSVKPGLINLLAHYATGPRWAMSAAAAVDGRYPASQPAALATWTLLGPLAADLLEPLILRGPEAGTLPHEQHLARWASIDVLYADLNVANDALLEALAPLRPGAGWGNKPAQAQLDAKQVLAAALGENITADAVRRWRVRQLRPLVERYYSKSKRGPATAAAVLTRAYQPIHSAWFAGDWLAFVDWLDEQPAAGEQILTTLPVPRLIVDTGARAAEVARGQGLPVADVEAMLAAYHGSATADSPIEKRVRVLRDWWQAVDAAHASQRPGMRPLVSLMSTRGFDTGSVAWPCPQPVSEQLFPASLLADIDDLWGTAVLPTVPATIVSAIDPNAGPVSAFGTAAVFWHEIALTCWFICEGPYARTDLAHLADTYRSETSALAAAGTPVPESLFAELRAAGKRLGRPRDIVTDRQVHNTGYGIEIETRMVRGQRRDGFEILRDIVTRYRRAWAATHLESALRAAWEQPLREVAEKIHRSVAARGKAPTARQLATMAAPAANAWFGGDLAALCAALGEPAPVEPVRMQLMPYDRVGLAERVFDVLGGQAVKDVTDPRYQASARLFPLLHDAVKFVQLEEALGRTPTIKELFRARNPLPDGLTFEQFAATVVAARQAMPTTRPAASATGRPRPSQSGLPAAAGPAASEAGTVRVGSQQTHLRSDVSPPSTAPAPTDQAPVQQDRMASSAETQQLEGRRRWLARWRGGKS